MAVDHIRYDLLAQEALRGVVRHVLADAARNGLPGDHHFYISFDTGAEGVRISSRLREQYPEEITIILQHQFWDLSVTDEGFEVGLSFGGVPERLVVPFAAIKGFFDPSVQFGLQFETIEPGADATADVDGDKSETPATAPLPQVTSNGAKRPDQESKSPADAPIDETQSAEAASKPKGEVVRLDRFRKK
ncbi:MAG: SspB family protein [Pseudorhodoplanes sp.]|jgi:hypothetical protein|nr:SspB family protein [Pseudorhodoplanes sp.]